MRAPGRGIATDCDPQGGGARGGVPPAFGLARPGRSGWFLETGGPALAGIVGQVTRSCALAAAARLEEALDDAVFQAVEADNGKPPAGGEHRLGRDQALAQLVQLAVHMDAD